MLGVTSSIVCAPTSWCHSVATFFCTRTLLSMMVPVIDQPASLRAMRLGLPGVILSDIEVTSRNVWLGSRSSAVPSASTRMRYAEPRWLPSVITVTPARPSTGKPARRP